MPRSFPRIKALVWFNYRIAQYGGWWDWEIESSAASQAAFQAAIGSNHYAPGGGFGRLPLRTTIAPLSPS
jgi:hypothetical protein